MATSLAALPFDVVCNVLLFLPFDDHQRTAHTCRALHDVATHNITWELYAHRDGLGAALAALRASSGEASVELANSADAPPDAFFRAFYTVRYLGFTELRQLILLRQRFDRTPWCRTVLLAPFYGDAWPNIGQFGRRLPAFFRQTYHDERALRARAAAEGSAPPDGSARAQLASANAQLVEMSPVIAYCRVPMVAAAALDAVKGSAAAHCAVFVACVPIAATSLLLNVCLGRLSKSWKTPLDAPFPALPVLPQRFDAAVLLDRTSLAVGAVTALACAGLAQRTLQRADIMALRIPAVACWNIGGAVLSTLMYVAYGFPVTAAVAVFVTSFNGAAERFVRKQLRTETWVLHGVAVAVGLVLLRRVIAWKCRTLVRRLVKHTPWQLQWIPSAAAKCTIAVATTCVLGVVRPDAIAVDMMRAVLRSVDGSAVLTGDAGHTLLLALWLRVAAVPLLVFGFVLTFGAGAVPSRILEDANLSLSYPFAAVRLGVPAKPRQPLAMPRLCTSGLPHAVAAAVMELGVGLVEVRTFVATESVLVSALAGFAVRLTRLLVTIGMQRCSFKMFAVTRL